MITYESGLAGPFFRRWNDSTIDDIGRRAMVEWLKTNHPTLNVLINNAGMQRTAAHPKWWSVISPTRKASTLPWWVLMACSTLAPCLLRTRCKWASTWFTPRSALAWEHSCSRRW